MRWINAAAQCVADFLVEERCHACAGRIRDADAARGAVAAARAVPAVVAGPLRLETRVLCADCAGEIRPWRDVVHLALPTAERGARGMPQRLSVYPAWETDERLLLLIHLLKFRRRASIAPWLARAMAESLPSRAREQLDRPAVLVPVPMDRASRARRGFNQAERIARELGCCWGLPVLRNAVVKPHATAVQSALGRDERLANVSGAFAAGRDPVRGQAVILVDDLVTTGATAAACARVLVAGGAAVVRVVCAGYRP